MTSLTFICALIVCLAGTARADLWYSRPYGVTFPAPSAYSYASYQISYWNVSLSSSAYQAVIGVSVVSSSSVYSMPALYVNLTASYTKDQKIILSTNGYTSANVFQLVGNFGAGGVFMRQIFQALQGTWPISYTFTSTDWTSATQMSIGGLVGGASDVVSFACSGTCVAPTLPYTMSVFLCSGSNCNATLQNLNVTETLLVSGAAEFDDGITVPKPANAAHNAINLPDTTGSVRGGLNFGGGDVHFYRSSSGTLKSDGKLTVTSDLRCDSSSSSALYLSAGGLLAADLVQTNRVATAAIYSPNGGYLASNIVQTTSSSTNSVYAPNGGSNVGLDASARHHLTASGTPTIAAGAASGTSPTLTIAGTDAGGVITLTTGTSPSSNAILFTVTYNTAYPTSVCGIALFPRTATAAAQMTNVFLSNSATTSFTIFASSALSAGVGYTWFYSINC